MQHGIDGEIAGEGKVADEFRGPLVDAVNAGIVGEHAEAGALEVVDSTTPQKSLQALLRPNA